MSSTPEDADRPGAVPRRAPDARDEGAGVGGGTLDSREARDADSGVARPEFVGEDEGEYVDRDVEAEAEREPEEVGAYTDSDLEAHPGVTDVGTYVDDDVATDHRPEPAEGSYTDAELTDDDPDARDRV